MKLFSQLEFEFSDVREQEQDLPAPVEEDEDEMLRRAITMSLEEQ